MISKQIIKGKCVAISSEGKGIIKTVYGVIFVDALLLGEEAEIEVTYSRAGVSYGKIRKLLSFSQDRINPKCPISTSCGGCVFQNASYKYELEYKTNKVKEDLIRIGHFKDIKVNPCIGMENPEHYRNKIQVPFGKANHHVIYGFYKSNTHKIIPLKECNIEDTRAKDILSTFASLMEKYHVDPYDEDSRRGIIRHLLIRTSSLTDEVMVVIIASVDSFYNRSDLVKELTQKHKNISSVIYNINKRDTNVILGDKEKVLYGKNFIKDSILGLNFNVSSKSFFQVNPKQVEVLYSKALELAKLTKEDELLDAYSGVGTIGLLASKYVKHVTSVEVVKEAVINAKKNAEMNNIKNITLLEDDCTEFINRELPHYDVVIMDPPRKGSTPEFLNALKLIKPSRIIYISCDPATLSRDLEILSTDYKIEVVQPVDMFPRTFHVETVVQLNKK